MTKTPKELYDRVFSDDGQTTMRELAKEFDMQSPSLTHHVTMYAIENELPLPNFLFRRKRNPDAMVKEAIHRSTSENYIQISPLRLKESGLEETMDFRFVGDPSNQIILVVPQSQKGNSVEEVFNLLYANKCSEEEDLDDEINKSPKGSIRNLRLPAPNSSTRKNLQTS